MGENETGREAEAEKEKSEEQQKTFFGNKLTDNEPFEEKREKERGKEARPVPFWHTHTRDIWETSYGFRGKLFCPFGSAPRNRMPRCMLGYPEEEKRPFGPRNGRGEGKESVCVLLPRMDGCVGAGGVLFIMGGGSLRLFRFLPFVPRNILHTYVYLLRSDCIAAFCWRHGFRQMS